MIYVPILAYGASVIQELNRLCGKCVADCREVLCIIFGYVIFLSVELLQTLDSVA
jgi:hypothetical protein